MASAKKAYADQRAIARSQDQSIVRALASHEHLGRTMLWDAQFDAKIQALTLDQINAAMRKHLDPAALTVVKAGDFQKAGAYQK